MSSTGVDSQQSSSLNSSPSGQHTPIGQGSIPAIEVDGYQLFSKFISSDPLRSTTIFRRFDRLAIRNLLYLESELAALERELDELDMSDIPETMINHLGDWNLLKTEAECAEEEDTSEDEKTAKVQELMIGRMKLVKKIREKVKEYHEALKLTREIFMLGRPDQEDVDTNGRIFAAVGKEDYDRWQDKAQQEDTLIHGAVSDHLCDKWQKDLCTLALQEERDMLTRLVESQHRFRTIIKDKDTQLTDPTKYRRFTKMVTWISVALVIAWLVGGIIGLYFWRSDRGRLILLSLLTLGFAFSILSTTTAKRHDVFSATAGYAAVMVVFIGSTLNGSADDRDTNAGTVSSRTLRARDVVPTRTFAAGGSDGFELHLNGKPIGDVVNGMLFVAGVLLCAFALLGLRRRGSLGKL